MTSTLRNTVLALGLSFGLIAACSSSKDDDGGNGGSGGSDEGGKGGSSSGGKGGSGSGGSAGGSAGGNTGGASASGGSSGPGAQTPDAQDAAGWKKFLQAGEFRKEGWKADVAAPRPKKSISPHGRVRVWFNEKAKTGQSKSPAVYDKGTMIVKEMFDAQDASIGYVSFWKIADDGANAWLVHCAGDKERCVQSSKTPTVDEPLLGDLSALTECSGCHHSGSNPTTGLVYTKVPQ